MNNQLTKAINKANHMPMIKENFLGLVIMLILSKDIFSSNIAVSEFITKTFKISFLNYAIRSRTLMCAKICRHINELDDATLKLAYVQFIQNVSLLDVETTNAPTSNQKTNSKGKHAIRNLNKWINVIKKDNE